MRNQPARDLREASGDERGHVINGLRTAGALTWVSLAFAGSYLAFFIYPVFWSGQAMQFFVYLPAIDPIGADLQQMLSYSREWLIAGQSPYIGNNLYPPLATVLFSPLLALDFRAAYAVMTVLTLACFSVATLALPLRLRGHTAAPLIVLVFATALTSYGLQFELERGQFNVIAMSCCLVAVWLFHERPRLRWLAYLLFTLAVQLKVFPFIFIVMLVSDWRDWRGNVRRAIALSSANLALTFVLGPAVFMDFIAAVSAQTSSPLIWLGNHSVRSFVASAVDILAVRGWPEVRAMAPFAELGLLSSVGVCLAVLVWGASRRSSTGLSVPALMGCTLAALLIPSVSHDYKLPLVAGPFALLMSDPAFDLSGRNVTRHLRLRVNGLTFIAAMAYCSTLVSMSNKPTVLDNNLPALLVLLVAATLLSVTSQPIGAAHDESRGAA